MFEEITINTYYMFIVIVVLNVSFRLGYDKKKKTTIKVDRNVQWKKFALTTAKYLMYD